MSHWASTDIISTGRLVRVLHEHLSVPVTCKIRVYPGDPHKTVQYAKMLIANGCQVRCLLLSMHHRHQWHGIHCADVGIERCIVLNYSMDVWFLDIAMKYLRSIVQHLPQPALVLTSPITELTALTHTYSC